MKNAYDIKIVNSHQSGKTLALDIFVRKRLYNALAWHVNHTHTHLSDHDLVQVAFAAYNKHREHTLIHAYPVATHRG